MGVFSGKTVLVGVSGGIAAYKTCSLVSRLTQEGADVHVVMTANATKFVSPLTFETLSRNRATVDTFDRNFSWEVGHVSLAKRADIAIVAPATANVIAKLACGIADDFLTTTLLACTCPIIIAPAMNTAMFNNAATVQNIKTLESRGYIVIYGGSGHLACGDSGNGRMAEPDELFAEIERELDVKRDYSGKTVLVTAGATRADIDPVRFISNRSSGKMGNCIAAAADSRGARVIYIKGSAHPMLTEGDDWTVVEVKTTSELLDAIKAHYQAADMVIMAAAPCDYYIAPADKKIKDKTLSLELKKAPDCAAWLGEHKGDKKLIVFAAETDDCEKNALKKLETKNADMLVLNDVTAEGAGFDVDTNIVKLIKRGDSSHVKWTDKLSKTAIANIILDEALTL